MERTFVTLGAVFAGLAVGAGAFGAHALRGRLDPQLFEVYETAARYQMYHALGLFAVAWTAARWPQPLLGVAGWGMVAGIVVFCGSLYVLSLTGVRWLGAVTPFGGLAFLVSWVALALAAWRG